MNASWSDPETAVNAVWTSVHEGLMRNPFLWGTVAAGTTPKEPAARQVIGGIAGTSCQLARRPDPA